MSVAAPASDKQRFYDTIADSFDDIMNEYDVNRRLEVVFNELLASCDLRGLRLLDAGCGTGRFSEWAIQRGAAVTSLDIGPALLRTAGKRCRSQLTCGDVTRLPFGDATFDIVVSSECIEHTPDPRRAVMEVVRVCRPGGRVVITCPNRVWRWSCTLANLLGLRPYSGLENWPGYYQLRCWLRSAGCRDLGSAGIHFFPFVVKATHPLLRSLDRLGRSFGPLFVNQAHLATK
ncbi:MAG TPA: methyltransferase domain-containing protein [Phycisphaerae bacterium]|nr:methyltransferase domain-containing protein [Phycisphaerae bacterium]